MASKPCDRTIQDMRQPLVIEAGRTELHYWRDLWRYSELLYFFAWRDISVRYRQTLLGILWVLVRPLLTMLVFTVVFGRIAGLPSDDVPYPIMVFAAMLPWQLFAGILIDSGNSIVNNGGMISKVYFPRMIIPLSTVLVNLLDFLIAAVLMTGLMIWYGVTPGWHIISLPLFIVLALAISIGAGLWVAALNVKYRDFRFIVPFAVQLGLYVSPVGFSGAIVPSEWQMLYALNPMVGVIEGFRWALSPDGAPPNWGDVLLSGSIAVGLLASAGIHFRRMEKSFADDI
ncbi:MAG TPA: ABC transporter permease [Paucimonas sp.]|nr:ABC transporter permease [Paucimonas sp.]